MSQNTVAQFMSAPLITIDENENLLEAERLMSSHHIHHLPVTRRGEFVGLVTQTDLLKAAIASLSGVAPLSEIRVRWVTRREVRVARDDLSGLAACRVMVRERLGCLPVVDAKTELVGIITRGDFTQLAMAALAAVGEGPRIKDNEIFVPALKH